mgnify:CR=1 FL=1
MIKMVVRAFVFLALLGLAVYGCRKNSPGAMDAFNKAVNKSTAAAPPPQAKPEPQIHFGGLAPLEPGLDAGRFQAPGLDAEILAVRIDPEYFELDILTAGEHGGTALTAADWARTKGLSFAINAGMYLDDARGTGVGYMKRAGKILSGRDPGDYKAALAFGPGNPDLPAVRIIDKQCHDYPALRDQYSHVLQSIRMTDCKGNVVWQRSDKRHTQAAAAADSRGRAVFAYVQEPVSTYEFAQALMALPLDIRSALYLEGGPPTQLFMASAGMTLSRSGLFSAGALPIPNVITAKPRK